MDWETIIKTIIGTGVVLKAFDYWRDSRRAKSQGDTSLQLHDRSELQEIRQWFAVEAEKAQEISEKIKEEKHQFELKVFMLERDLKDERRFSSEQDEEIRKLTADNEALKAELAHLKRVSRHEIASD